MANKNIQLQSANGTDNLYPLCKFNMLWENSSSSSGYSGGTIPIDLSNYALILIVFKNLGGWEISNEKYYSLVMRVGASANWAFGLYNNYYIFRSVSCNDTGVTFGQGYYNTSATESSTSANAMVPIQIIGLVGKYEKLV